MLSVCLGQALQTSLPRRNTCRKESRQRQAHRLFGITGEDAAESSASPGVLASQQPGLTGADAAESCINPDPPWRKPGSPATAAGAAVSRQAASPGVPASRPPWHEDSRQVTRTTRTLSQFGSPPRRRPILQCRRPPAGHGQAPSLLGRQVNLRPRARNSLFVAL